MGHIVNPISHRLGNSKCWNSVWSNNSDFSLRYSSLMKSDWDISLFFKRFFDLKILVQSGYIFSHVKIIRERRKIFCIVYFYDGGSLERSDNMRHILLSKTCQLFGLENLFLVSLYAFLRLYQWNSYYMKLIQNFKFQLLFHYFVRKKRFMMLKTFWRQHLIESLFKNISFVVDFFLVLNIRQSFFYERSIKFYLGLFLPFIGIVDYLKFLLISISCLLTDFISVDLSVCFYLQRRLFLNFYFFVKRYKIISIDLQHFFLKNISDLFVFMRWRMFCRSSILSKLVRYGFNFLSFNRYFLYYFADVFSSYFRLRSRFLNSINHTFRRLFTQKDNFKTKIVLKKMDVTDLNATVMAKYITIRLRQRFQLKEALLPMLRHLSYNEYVRGFRVVCAGRFTRKEIALYDLRTYSSVPFSGVSSKLDFALSEVVLKYSICGVKVWLHRVTLPEREYIIDAIGLQFILPPPIHEMFQENLELLEEFRDMPFRFETMNKISFEKLAINDYALDFDNSRKKFVTFATRISPSFDFFFVDYKRKTAEANRVFLLFKDGFLA